MAKTDEFQAPSTSVTSRALAAVLVVLAICLAYYVYRQMTSVRGVTVEAPSPTAIDMLPPPPPPPPPPPQLEKPPPEPTNQPSPAPSPEPAKAPDAPAPMTINGPSQAGADSFGLQSGSGAGSGAPGGSGTCLVNCGGGIPGGALGSAFYTRYLTGALQEKVQADNRVNRLVFTADFLITITPQGRVTQAVLARSSGRDDRDAALKAILEAISGLDPPPGSIRFPQKITVRGRRSL